MIAFLYSFKYNIIQKDRFVQNISFLFQIPLLNIISTYILPLPKYLLIISYFRENKIIQVELIKSWFLFLFKNCVTSNLCYYCWILATPLLLVILLLYLILFNLTLFFNNHSFYIIYFYSLIIIHFIDWLVKPNLLYWTYFYAF